MTSMTEPDERSEYIAGLRAFADALEAAPEVPLPDYGTSMWPIRWVVTLNSSEEQKATCQHIVRGIGGEWSKNPSDEYFSFNTCLRGLHVEVMTHRETVCRRVVTGTEEVTSLVPAPGAPMVEVTETVESVEWVCEPLLAAVAS